MARETRAVIPIGDGSGRYLVEVEPDEYDDPDVLHIVEPESFACLPKRRSRLTRRTRAQRSRGEER